MLRVTLLPRSKASYKNCIGALYILLNYNIAIDSIIIIQEEAET